MSFDNQLQFVDRPTSILSESSDIKPTVSQTTKSNMDQNHLTSRVDKLIHETSLFTTPKSTTSEVSERSSLLTIPKVVTTMSPLTSMSMSTNSHFDYTNGIDTLSDDDNHPNGDVTSTSRSVDEEQDTDHHSSYYSTSSGDSFYDDHTLNPMMEDDEISGPEVTSIFCR
jgi:hypothetical protein